MRSKHLSRAEAADALEALSREDLARLVKAGRRLARGTRLTGDDLFHDAVVKVLARARLCPRGVAFPRFLANVMRSLAWAGKERDDPLGDAADIADLAAVAVSSPSGSPEERLVAKRDYKARQQALVDLFADDEEALGVLLMLFEDKSREEIQAARRLGERLTQPSVGG